jgi:Mg-chelatase subunit ChlD
MIELSPYLQKVMAGQIKVATNLIKTITVAISLRLVFIIDRSWSMAEACGQTNRIEAAKNAISALLDVRRKLDADDEIAVISFNSAAQLVLPFTGIRESDRIQKAVRAIWPEGSTDLKPALSRTSDILPEPASAYIIVLSDGHCGDPIRVATALKNKGAIIETIGVGDTRAQVDEEKLIKVASVQDGQVLYRFLTNADELLDYFRKDIAGRLAKRG